jgi:predicted ArsR family transcriptional regulator
MDLFDFALAKPAPDPVFDTRRAAYEQIAPSTSHLRSRVLAALATHGPMTADQCAVSLNIDRLAIRPRFTELKAAGLIVDTGTRRANSSGRTATVWRRQAGN